MPPDDGDEEFIYEDYYQSIRDLDYDYGEWSGYVSGYDPLVPEWFAYEASEKGFDPTDVIENSEMTLHLDENGFWVEVDGEQIGPYFDADNNADIWWIYDWWEMETGEPPEKDFSSPGGD